MRRSGPVPPAAAQGLEQRYRIAIAVRLRGNNSQRGLQISVLGGEQLRGGNLPLFQLQPRQAQGFGRRPLGKKRLLQCHGVVPDGMESIRDILKCSQDRQPVLRGHLVEAGFAARCLCCKVKPSKMVCDALASPV